MLKSQRISPHLTAVFQALLVTFLWSTSWVLIKIGLQDIPALTFAGLRYSLAFACLLPLALWAERNGSPNGSRSDSRGTLRGLSARQWLRLGLLGLLLYAITQGAQFLGLSLLPAVTVSLLLNFTTSAVALLGIAWLREVPGLRQWSGILLAAAGSLIYFYPVDLPAAQLLGLAIVAAGVLANAVSAVLGRQVNRDEGLPPLVVTVVSMGIGGGLLLLAGVLTQGWPPLALRHWAIIAWLALVNTAFAFTLWNRTLQTLSAVESSIINSTMLVQIALLAWIFLDERLGGKELLGMALVGLGTLIVQLRGRQAKTGGMPPPADLLSSTDSPIEP